MICTLMLMLTAASSMPSGAYMLHVYQHPGTCLSSLQLIDPQGR
jgi:hypothetical protein